MHRNLLLPLGVKLEPDYKSDDSILEEDFSSSDESLVMIDSKSKVKDGRKSLAKSSKDKSQTEIKREKSQSKEEKHVEFVSKLEISPDSNLKSNTVVVDVEDESIGEKSHPNVEDSSDKVIPADVSFPSKFLLPILDDSSYDEETEITELKSEAEIHDTNQEEEMLSVNSQASSLVNTNELLEFKDTIDMDSSENTIQFETTMESEQIVESDNDPKKTD